MIKTFTGCLLLFFGFSPALLAQEAGQTVTPQVWLRADTDSTANSTWLDVSGSGNHAFTTAKESKSVLFNFNPTKSFNTDTEISSIAYSLEGLSETSFMIIYQPSDTIERGILGTKDAIERNVMITTQRVLGPDSVVDQFSIGKKAVLMNSIIQSWEEAKSVTSGASLTFGGLTEEQQTKPFEGHIAELLIFDQVLPYLDRIQYETYLALKYGVTLNDKNYVSSGEGLLWDAEENSEFSNNIMGIGKDDHFKLNQKQSQSTNDTTKLILFSAGEAKESNETNPYYLNDQDFLLFGDNAGEFKTSKGEGEDSVLSVVDRKWLLTANGMSAHQITTSLQVDISKFPADSLGYWLVIDRSGRGNFSVDNLEYLKADSTKNNIAFYNNIKWDTDLSGKDNFGFAIRRSLFAVARTVQKPKCTDIYSGIIKLEVIEGRPSYNFSWRESGSENIETFRKRDSVLIEELAPAIYEFGVSDNTGQSFKRSKKLEFSDAIPVNLGPDQKLEQGSEIILDARKAIPDTVEASYYWESSFGVRSSEEKLTVTESGIYRLYITNKANDCVFSDEITISGSNIERVSTFPNPISQNSRFNISISLKEDDDVEVKLFDMQGMLYEKMEGKGQSEYQFRASLPQAGSYFIVVETPGGSTSKKIIVY